MPLLLLGLLFVIGLIVFIRLSGRMDGGDAPSEETEVPQDDAGGTVASDEEEVRREGNVIFLPQFSDRNRDAGEK